MTALTNNLYNLFITAALLTGIMLSACKSEKPRTFTVGIVNVVPVLDSSIAGFKEGMEELNYKEGKNIRYIYPGATTDMDELPADVQSLLAAKIDLILTVTTPATLAAKKVTAGIGLPVVFAVVTDPVGAGIVKNLRNPGGNITGVTFGIQEARRLEWLLRIAPQTRHIYVPFYPKDKSPVLALKVVRDTAAKLGVKLITREVTDKNRLNTAVLTIPAKADAVFLLPDSYVSSRLPDLVATATKSGLPVSAPNITNVKNNHVLTSYGVDLFLSGKQTARMVNQIFKGARPADLPVEMAEFYLAINIKVAKKIGLTIPDEILRHAHIIIR